MAKGTNNTAELIKNILKFIFLGNINYHYDDLSPYEDAHYDLESIFPSKETEEKLRNYLQNK